MQTQTITIQGTEFTIGAPYSAGHVLTAGEASALNQLRGENIRNNFAGKMKSAKEKGEPIPGQEELTKYDGEYAFGVRAIGGPRLDPIESKARQLAKVEIDKALKAKNIDKKNVPAETYDKLVTDFLAKYPAFREKAKAIVEAEKSAIDLGGLDLGSLEAPAAA